MTKNTIILIINILVFIFNIYFLSYYEYESRNGVEATKSKEIMTYLTPYSQMDSAFFKEYQEQKKHIYIRYKQPVEGYTVTALCTMDELDILFSENNGIHGKALLRFENDSTHFYIYNSSFSDSILYYGMKKEIKDKEVIYIDYRPISDNDICYCSTPFFFHDVNFDGRKELLINKWQTRPKGHSSFDIYDLQSNPKKLTEPPFDKYDHMTRVDSINKTITLYEGSRISGCAVSHTYQLHYRQIMTGCDYIENVPYFKPIKVQYWHDLGNDKYKEYVADGDSLKLVKSIISDK